MTDGDAKAAAALSPLNVTIIAAADDVDIARSLARQLLRYRLPARLVGEPSRDGAVPRQIEQGYLNLYLASTELHSLHRAKSESKRVKTQLRESQEKQPESEWYFQNLEVYCFFF